jgi:flagellar export protein FliJ
VTHDKPTPGLARLAELREREVTKRQADLALSVATGERYRRKLEQLDTLWQTSTVSASLAPSLSLNSANYKQTVMEMASRHRADLARHDTQTDQARLALLQATRRHGAIDQVLTLQLQAQARALRSGEQKRQDELASQQWMRRP